MVRLIEKGWIYEIGSCLLRMRRRWACLYLRDRRIREGHWSYRAVGLEEKRREERMSVGLPLGKDTLVDNIQNETWRKKMEKKERKRKKNIERNQEEINIPKRRGKVTRLIPFFLDKSE